MKVAPIPSNEDQRLQTLLDYEILDTEAEAQFDEITKAASLFCKCQISLISLIDSKRQWFKSKTGLDASETPRDISFCSHAILGKEIFIVEDASKDSRFFDNPLFLKAPNVKFYAGAPLIAPNGEVIGTLCVINNETIKLTEEQKILLKALSKQVINYLELKRKNKELFKKTKEIESYATGLDAHAIVAKTDFDGRITYVNQKFCEISEYSKDELLGKNHNILNSGYHSSEFFRDLWTKIKNGNLWIGEILNQAKSGKKYWVDTIISPIKDENNQIKEFISIRYDITKRKQIELRDQLVSELRNFYIENINSPQVFFSYILEKILFLTESKYGFIGKILINNQNTKYLKTFAQTDISWDESSRKFYQDNASMGLEFTNLNTLFGKVIKEEKIFITNNPSQHPEAAGIPKGHPPLNSFMGIPLIYQHKFIGMVGVANRQEGYNQAFFDYLEPFFEAIGGTLGNYLQHEKNNEQENKLRQLFAQSQDPTMTLEPPNWYFSSCNPAALKLFNVKSENEFIKLGPWNLSPEYQADGEASATKAPRMIKLAMDNGSHFFEWMHSTIDGKEIPCTVLLSRIKEMDKIYLHAVVRDYSEQKKLQKKLLESNQYLELALDGAGLGIWDWNLKDNSVSFDRRWAQMLGLKLEEIQMNLSTWESRVHPDDLKQCLQDINDYVQGKTNKYENIHRMKHKNGKWIYILDKGRFSDWDKDGKPIRFTGTHLDITQTKMAHDEKMVELNEILSSTPSCLKIVSKQGELLDMNKQGLGLIEAQDLSSVYKANVYDIVEESHRDKFIEFNEKICAGNRGHLIFEIIGLNGTRRWMETYAAPYKLPNGEIAQIAITNDISEKIKQENELNKQKMISQHQAKLASIGELAAGVGHEINNPLAIVKGYVSTLNRYLLNTESISKEYITTYLNKIDAASNRIANIVQGLRTFSRYDDDELKDFSPSDAILESYHLIKEIYEKDNILFNLNIAESVRNQFILGNRGKFQQIIINLLSNAKDAIMNNKLSKIIDVSLHQENNNLILKICDNGHGIPKEIFDKIFDPFFTTKDVNQGTGIGLSIVHNFVKELKGEIEVQNQFQGCCFTIKIPNLKELKKMNLKVSTVQNQELSFNGNVLIVDDEPSVAELLKFFLNEYHLSVDIVNKGETALKEYMHNPTKYDLIISDMKMPGMDGITLLNQIRNQKSFQPKFVFITGGVNIDLTSEEFSKKIDGHLLKPFNEDLIKSMLIKCFPKQ